MQGFYKVNLIAQSLAFAPNYVNGPDFTLHKDDAEDAPSKTGIINGWKWFNSDVEAYSYFGMTPESNPWTITPLQAKLALNAAGLLDSVETFVAAADKTVQIAWEYASEYRRDSPMLLAMGDALGMTNQQLDDLFAAAKLIEV